MSLPVLAVCVCGHDTACHNSGRRTALGAPTLGVCLWPGCACREYTEDRDTGGRPKPADAA
jgi:hypothetical protein